MFLQVLEQLKMANKIEALIKEKQRRQSLPNLLEACFDKQKDFINDESRRKALFVARRSGKTWTVAVMLIKYCLEAPATKCLYFGLTAESAWNTIYLHMIEVLCRDFNIKTDINVTQKTITFDNKSFIKITGDDANDKQIDKALGGKYKVVVFDECQSINHDLENWIKNKLAPAMVDLDGTIVMAGTAGDLMGERFWYKVTKTEGAREAGWRVHSWTPFDNPFMKDKIQKHFADLKADNANIEEDPGFRQQWLCQWVIETSGRIYKYDPVKNSLQDKILTKSLTDQESKWKFVIGMDFGYEDPNAIVVGGFYKHDPTCYIVDSYKKNHLQLDEIAELVLQWRDKYKPIFIVGDAQDKIVIETLRNKHRIPIVAAQKLGKFAHIVAMNSDFLTGKIKVIESNNRALIKEWDELVWAESKRLLGEYKENPTKDNHLADACLYLHHFSKHYRATPEPIITEQEQRMTIAEQRLKKQLQQDTNNEQTAYDIYDIQDFVADYKRNM